jgi:hypothetical protein
MQPGTAAGPPPYGYQPYQPYPAAAQRLNVPLSVQNAARLMYAGAGLSLILVIADFARGISIESDISQEFAPYPASQVQGVAADFIGGFFALIGIGLWIWMAWASKRGRPWSRILATVLFGLFTLFTLGSIVAIGPASIVFELITLVVGAITMSMLWRAESTAYYQAGSSLR